LPGLEIHTLNQVETELPEALLARAVNAADGTLRDAQEKALEQSGAFSLEEGLLFSATGAPLPNVESEIVEKQCWQEYDSPLGRLATKAAISSTTACWSIIKSRTDKGYVRVYNSASYGLEDTPGNRFGMNAHKLALLLHRIQIGESAQLAPRSQIDHVCRNTACCNPNHLDVVNNTENDIRKRRAHPVEAALSSGQIIVGPVGLGWLDTNVERSDKEETNVIVNTRFGPYRIIKVDDEPVMFYGKYENDELFERLKPPTPRKSPRKSRARKVGIIAGQAVLNF